MLILVNSRDLQLECARVFHEPLLVPLLTYGSETMLWKEKEVSKIGVVQMDNLSGLLGFRRMNRIYVGDSAGNRSLGRPRKRWIDTVKGCLRKRGLDVRQARRMAQDKSEW